MSIVRVRFLEDGREAEIPLDILSFKAPKKLTKEEWKKLAEQYKGRPLPPEYYADFKPGKLAFIQWHIRGILPEDKEAYDKGKKSFSEIIVGHSLHQDFRMWFQGLSKPVEWVILDDSMEAYERYNLGKRDPKTGNVQKSLAVVKEAEALKEKATKKAQDKLLISEKDTKIIEKYALHEYDNWLPPGDVGATPYAWGVLVTISIGVAQPGVQRQSLHEYFYYPSKDLPKRNQKLMNGRIIFRAFKKPRPLWWTWMAIRDPRPYNPYCFDSETEIYTKNGWKSVDTIKRSDLVASLNPKTLEWEWSGIKQIIKFNYSGTAYLFESRDISLLAHPNHMQPLFVDYKNAISFVSAQEYSPKYCWWFLRGANWRKQDNNIMWIGNKAYPKRNLCELIGWILGDGYLTKPAGEKHYYIGIRQEKQTNLNIIYQLAKATTRKVRKYKDRVVIRDHVLADFLAKEIGSVAGERRVPEFIRESSAENIQAFLYGLLGSDGHFRNRSKEPEGWGERIFYTSSASLAGSLAELILKAGGSVSYYLDCRKGKICFDKYIEKTDSYHIRWKKSTTTLSRWVEKKEVFYNGIMWDVELEKNHILLVRRHGRVFWTGNCGIDQGVYHLTPAEDLKYINKEDYPEWKNRKEDCE